MFRRFRTRRFRVRLDRSIGRNSAWARTVSETAPLEIEQLWSSYHYPTRRFCDSVAVKPLEQLVAWARIDQRLAELTSQLEIGRSERQQLKAAVGDPATRVREADEKWAEASLCAIRADTATRICAGADRLAAFGTISANIDRFKRAIGNSFHHLRGWACTALSAQHNFPLESGLFDLVIVDEASQCSLSSRTALGIPRQTFGCGGRSIPTESDHFPQRWALTRNRHTNGIRQRRSAQARHSSQGRLGLLRV